MIGTFAGQLQHFAHSVDIVDDATFDSVRTLVYQYLRREFKRSYFELLREHVTGNGKKKVALRTFWSSNDRDEHWWEVISEEGAYTNPITAAFDRGTPLWLVSANKGQLDDAVALRDSWSGLTDIPSYRSAGEVPASTAVVVPLLRHRVLGAYVIETPKHIEKTSAATAELLRLGDAISILFELYDVNRTQSRCTGAAIDDLRELLTGAKFPKTALPHFFFASSGKGDRAVRTVIREVLEEYSDQLEVTDWERIYESGDIPRQIAREIGEAAFGACYLSEPCSHQDGSATAFVDNGNVVFEAGMLHARTTASSESSDGEPRGWFPIRESDSPPPPFDFQSERILFVPRNKAGGVAEDTFRDQLRKRIDKLIGN